MCGTLVLRAAGRESLSGKYDMGISKGRILLNWKSFVLDNRLKTSDVCVFELIKGTPPFLYFMQPRRNQHIK